VKSRREPPPSRSHKPSCTVLTCSELAPLIQGVGNFDLTKPRPSTSHLRRMPNSGLHDTEHYGKSCDTSRGLLTWTRGTVISKIGDRSCSNFLCMWRGIMQRNLVHQPNDQSSFQALTGAWGLQHAKAAKMKGILHAAPIASLAPTKTERRMSEPPGQVCRTVRAHEVNNGIKFSSKAVWHCTVQCCRW
jgi:hypothetical protein